MIDLEVTYLIELGIEGPISCMNRVRERGQMGLRGWVDSMYVWNGPGVQSSVFLLLFPSLD